MPYAFCAGQDHDTSRNVKTTDETQIIPRAGHLRKVDRDPWADTGTYRAVAAEAEAEPTPYLAWLIPAVLTLAVSLVEIGRPALWTDELATFGVATTPIHDVVRLVKTTDAVNSPYYFVMIGWTRLFGTSDLSLRMPSVIAMTVAAGMIGALGARLLSARAGLVAGIIFALVPTTSRYAQEARAYGFVVLAATVATYALHAAYRKPTFWRFAVYALSLTLLGAMNAVALLILVAHAWVVIAQHREVLFPWAFAAASGILPVVPLFMLGHQQQAQVAWIPSVNGETFSDYPQVVFGSLWVGVLLIAFALFALPLRRFIATFTAWAVIPPLALIAISQVTPLYLPRYVLFTVPAWALLAAAALQRSHLALSVAAIAAIVAVGLPAQIAVREPDGHQLGTRSLAQTIAESERSGDAVIYGMLDPGGDWVGRATVAHYVPASAQPTDVLAARPGVDSAYVGVPESIDVGVLLKNVQRVWVVRQGDEIDPLAGLGATKETALRGRYDVDHVWHYTGLTLALLEAKSIGTTGNANG